MEREGAERERELRRREGKEGEGGEGGRKRRDASKQLLAAGRQTNVSRDPGVWLPCAFVCVCVCVFIVSSVEFCLNIHS